MLYLAIEHGPGGWVVCGVGHTEAAALRGLNQNCNEMPGGEDIRFDSIKDIRRTARENPNVVCSYLVTSRPSLYHKFLRQFDL